MQIKLLAVFAFVLLLLVILLVRIAYINVSSGQKYARQVLSQENYDSQTLYARRGEIQDANGQLLAYSERQYNLILDCDAVNEYEDEDDYQDYVDETVRALTENFDLEESEIRDRISDEKTRESQYQILLQNVTEEQKDAYEDYVSLDSDRELSDSERRELEHVVGVWFEEQYQRQYPMGSLASSVIGFSNDSDDGICGLESYYDSLLNGTNGRVYGYLNENQEYQRRTIAPENGHTLITTLDTNIQQIVQKYIDAFDETYGEDLDDGTAKHGAANVGVVVMDPNSGGILAMGTNSEFDLNDPQNLDDWYTLSEENSMSEEEYVEALNDLWSNYCVSEAYEPGSTVKPITVASALDCGAVTADSYFYCDGGEFITDTQINCDNIYGHGDESLGDTLKNSCNDAMMQIGFKMGGATFREYQSLFNFGKLTGIDLPNENAGSIHTEETMNEVELATDTFGQGFTCNMIQEATAFSAVVNGGYYYQPHVVSQILDEDGRVVRSMDDLLLKQPISTEVSEIVRGYLETAVQEGTGQRAQVPGYRVGGKTGTAEKFDPDTGVRSTERYLVSFIGAVPINDPQVVIYVVVDEPNVEDQANSTYAQTLFREIATEVLPYMEIYPTEEVTDELLAYLGLTREDVAEGARQTFAAFDTYGNYYTDAYVDDSGTVVTSDGTPIEGAYVADDGTVYDAYANPVATLESGEGDEELDPTAENPNIPGPLETQEGDGEDTSVWDGTVTDEELEDGASSGE